MGHESERKLQNSSNLTLIIKLSQCSDRGNDHGVIDEPLHDTNDNISDAIVPVQEVTSAAAAKSCRCHPVNKHYSDLQMLNDDIQQAIAESYSIMEGSLKVLFFARFRINRRYHLSNSGNIIPPSSCQDKDQNATQTKTASATFKKEQRLSVATCAVCYSLPK